MHIDFLILNKYYFFDIHVFSEVAVFYSLNLHKNLGKTLFFIVVKGIIIVIYQNLLLL